MNKAPAGGMVSAVNKQFYNGGEFMPVNGLFCGKKGAARRGKWEKALLKNKAKDLGGSRFFEVTEYVGNGLRVVVGFAIANTHKQAEQAFFKSKPLSAREV